MRLATQYDRIHGAGAEVMAISVDDEVRQAGMSKRWGQPATRWISDPGGERFLQPLDLFDPEERGGIALPALLVIAPDGSEVHRYAGRDFADRTHDDDVLAAVEALGLDAVDAPDWSAAVDAVEVPDDLRGFFRSSDLLPYFRGNMYAALAVGWRLEDDASQAIAKEHRAMSKSITDAGEAWRPNFA